MFAVNDQIFYSTAGVCKIADIRLEKFGSSEAQEFYVLKPIYNSKSITYVPTANEELLAKMRPLLTKDEIYNLIQHMPDEEAAWISDDRQRSEAYNAKVVSGDSHELIKLIRALYLEKNRKKETGKKLSTTDAKIMTTAENLLHEEFAVVLGIDPAEVVPFILARIPQ